MIRSWTGHHSGPFAWDSGSQVIMLWIIFSFFHRRIISFHKSSIYRQEPQVLILCCLMCIFDSQSDGSHWLVFYESPRTTDSAIYSRKRVTYISDGLRMSKSTANFHYWVNDPFLYPCVISWTLIVIHHIKSLCSRLSVEMKDRWRSLYIDSVREVKDRS